MRSIPLAMTWEMLRHGRWTLIAGALGANALPAILFAALRQDGAINPQDHSQIVMHVMLMQINLFIFGAAVFQAQGSPSRLYVFPVPTSRLVAWHLIPAMAAMALESLASTAVLNALFDLRWPLWGPALFAAVAVAAVKAAQWLTERSRWLAVALTFVAVVLGIWFNSRHGAAFSAANHFWYVVTPSEVLTLLAIALLAYAVAVLGVTRDRCGQSPYSLGIFDWLGRAFDSAPRVGLPFRTPEHAQLWFEWRKKGWVMPVIVAIGLFMGLGMWLIVSRDAKQLLDGLVAGGGLLSLAGLFVGMAFGNCGPSDSDFQLGNFLATRPLSSTDLARTILKTAAKSVFIAWFIWAASCLTLSAILLAIHIVPRLAFPAELGWWYFPATLLGAWTVVSLSTPVGMTGRRGFVATLFVGLFALFVGLMMFSKYALSDQAREQFAYGVAAACGVLFVLGTVWAFVAARRRSLIGSPTLFIAASVWAALSTLVALGWAPHPLEPISAYVFGAGILALAVAPLATAPLALAWNRTR